MQALINLFFQNIDAFIKFLKALTFKRVFLFGFFVAIVLGGYVVFENRQTIYNQSIGRFDSIENRQTMNLSEGTKHAIKEFTKDRPYIEFVQVVDMDLYRNTRTAVFWHSESISTNMLLQLGPYNNGGPDRKGISLPLLTDDVVQNKQMIRLINLREDCSPAIEGSAPKLYPALKDKLTISCRFPIPPRGGERINGFFAVHLNTELDAFQMDQLRLQASQLAMQIFLTDIDKK